MQGGSLATNIDNACPNVLGFIGSFSTPVIDSNDTGDVYIEIRWATPSVLWAITITSAPTTFNTTTDCYFNNL